MFRRFDPVRAATSLAAVVALCGAAWLVMPGEEDNPQGFPEAEPVVSDIRFGKGLSEDMRAAAAASISGGAADIGEITASDPSLLYLLVIYHDGSVASGSATLIMGDDGLSRALSASHVLKDPDSISRIVALDETGGQIAQLRPLLTGNGGGDPYDLTARSAGGDLSVLTPVAFSSREASRGWNARGIPLSRSQPDSVMAVSFGTASTMANTGLSGGSVRTAAGVVGVMNYIFYPEGGGLSSRSGYLDRAIARSVTDGDPLKAGASLARIASLSGNEHSGGTGLAVPVTRPHVLGALRVSDVRRVTVSRPFKGRIFGFPNNEMRASDVVVSPMPGHDPEY